MNRGVVVVGGGFGALEVSLALRKLRPDVSVRVISDQDDVTYRPWLIKVPAGGPPAPLIPFAKLLESAGAQRIEGRAAGVDLDMRRVILQSGAGVDYEQLVVATGAVADRERVAGSRAHAFFPCDLADAAEFADAVSRRAAEVAVVFGWERPGPGLEYAAWIARHRPGVRVTAIDADGTLARRFGDRATARIARLFQRRGGTLVNEGPVVRIDDGAIQLETRAVVADVIALAAPLKGDSAWLPSYLLDERGMLKVDGAMAAAPGLFGIGDVVAVPEGYRLPPALFSIRSTARPIAANVIGAREGAQLKPVLRPHQPDMLGPDLAGDAILVRDRRLVVSGPLALLMRSFIDRSYLRKRRARMGAPSRLSGASRTVS